MGMQLTQEANHVENIQSGLEATISVTVDNVLEISISKAPHNSVGLDTRSTHHAFDQEQVNELGEQYNLVSVHM